MQTSNVQSYFNIIAPNISLTNIIFNYDYLEAFTIYGDNTTISNTTIPILG